MGILGYSAPANPRTSEIAPSLPRRFDSRAIERILERQGAVPLDEPAPLGGLGAALLADVDSGSLDTYSALDSLPTTPRQDNTEDSHGS